MYISETLLSNCTALQHFTHASCYHSCIIFYLTKISTFKVSPKKIIKGMCYREWVSVVLYAVYLHLPFTETVIENDKIMVTKLSAERGVKQRP